MAYVKTNWVNNDEPPISAANLQNVEDGIEHNDIRLNNLDNIMSLTPNSWVANQEYAIHDIVVYNGMLYENISADNTDITPDSDVNNWSETKLLVKNSDGLVKINSQIVDNQYILATTTSTGNTQPMDIVLNSIVDKAGDWTLSNGNIIIPSGINKIRVSACAFYENPSIVGYVFSMLRINRGGTTINISDCISPIGNTSAYVSTPIPASIIDVQENDQIIFHVDNPSRSTNRTGRINTWVLVEKIK